MPSYKLALFEYKALFHDTGGLRSGARTILRACQWTEIKVIIINAGRATISDSVRLSLLRDGINPAIQTARLEDDVEPDEILYVGDDSKLWQIARAIISRY